MDISNDVVLKTPSYRKVFRYLLGNIAGLSAVQTKIILVIFRCTVFSAIGSIELTEKDLKTITGLSENSIRNETDKLENQKLIKVYRDEESIRYSLNLQHILTRLNKPTKSSELINTCISQHSYIEEIKLIYLGVTKENQFPYRLWNFYCTPILDLNNDIHSKCIQSLVKRETVLKISRRVIEIILSQRVEHCHSDSEIMEIFGVTEQ